MGDKDYNLHVVRMSLLGALQSNYALRELKIRQELDITDKRGKEIWSAITFMRLL